MTAKRVDTNQAEIVRGQRQVGAWVWDTHTLGHGFPDLLVYFRGRFYLQEVKRPGGKLTPDEMDWHLRHPGAAHVVYSLGDALLVIGALEQARPVVVKGVKGEA